jgi:hypothetical protein
MKTRIAMVWIVALVGCAEQSDAPENIAPDAHVSTSSSGSGGASGTGGATASASASSAIGSGGDSAVAASASASASSVSTSGSGGAGGSGQSTSAASISTSVSVAASSSASGEPEPVDCAAAPLNSPCDDGLCASDGTCRTLAACSVRINGRRKRFECLDSRVTSIAVSSHLGVYTGCSFMPDLTKHRLITCAPGEQCSVHVIPGDDGVESYIGQCAT